MTNVYEFSDRAMGCEIAASIVMDNAHHAARLWDDMRREIDAYDMRYSRFRPESELSRLNTAGHAQVSSEFFSLIELGAGLTKKTDGAFSILADIARFGYDEDIDVVAGSVRNGAPPAPYSTDLAALQLDPATCSVTLPIGGRIDFGGFLKGYLAERLAKNAQGIVGIVVNLGGDLYARGVDEHGHPFLIGVDGPNLSEQAILHVADAAVATSGTYKRQWIFDGVPMHHILRADGGGNPPPDLVSATVVAATGADAEALSTSAIVLGEARARALLEREGASYVLIRTDGTVVRSALPDAV